MAANTRPYFVTHKGVQRLVNAATPANAVQHVVGSEIQELRPARASEVATWYGNGHPVDTAGTDMPLSAGVKIGVPALAPFDASDARAWLIEQCGGLDAATGALAAFDAAREAGFLTLEQERAITAAAPTFSSVIENRELENDETIAFDDVVTAIGEAVETSEAAVRA